jgi:hypothetical protein
MNEEARLLDLIADAERADKAELTIPTSDLQEVLRELHRLRGATVLPIDRHNCTLTIRFTSDVARLMGVGLDTYLVLRGRNPEELRTNARLLLQQAEASLKQAEAFVEENSECGHCGGTRRVRYHRSEAIVPCPVCSPEENG